MLKRESIVREIWHRASHVDGVVFTARNPKAPPGVNNLPAILLFELDDVVQESSKRESYPYYSRRISITVELFIKGTSEASSSKELGEFLHLFKRRLYEGGNTLGGLGVLVETSTSRVLRPPVGEAVSGIGVSFDVLYFEDTDEIANVSISASPSTSPSVSASSSPSNSPSASPS